MEEIQQIKTLEDITEQINKLFTNVAKTCLQLGKYLFQAKEIVPKKEWKGYVEANFQFGTKSATKYIGLYKEYEENYEYSYLGAEKLVELKQIDARQRADFIKNNDVEHITLKQLRELIKEEKGTLSKEKKPTEVEKLKKELEQAKEEIEELKKQQLPKILALPITEENGFQQNKRDLEERTKLSREFLKKNFFTTEKTIEENKEHWFSIVGHEHTIFVSEVDQDYQIAISTDFEYDENDQWVEWDSSDDLMEVYIYDYSLNQMYRFNLRYKFMEDYNKVLDELIRENNILYGDIYYILQDTWDFIKTHKFNYSEETNLRIEYAEKGYRYMMKKYHPDNKETGDRKKFEFIQAIK